MKAKSKPVTAPQTGWIPLWQAPFFASSDGGFTVDPDEWKTALRDDVSKFAPQEFEPSINVSGLQASITAGGFTTCIEQESVRVCMEGQHETNLLDGNLLWALDGSRVSIDRATGDFAEPDATYLRSLARLLPDGAPVRTAISIALDAAEKRMRPVATISTGTLKYVIDNAEACLPVIKLHETLMNALIRGRRDGLDRAIQLGTVKVWGRKGTGAYAPFERIEWIQWRDFNLHGRLWPANWIGDISAVAELSGESLRAIHVEPPPVDRKKASVVDLDELVSFLNMVSDGKKTEADVMAEAMPHFECMGYRITTGPDGIWRSAWEKVKTKKTRGRPPKAKIIPSK